LQIKIIKLFRTLQDFLLDSFEVRIDMDSRGFGTPGRPNEEFNCVKTQAVSRRRVALPVKLEAPEV
jgi:hypothetical protein